MKRSYIAAATLLALSSAAFAAKPPDSPKTPKTFLTNVACSPTADITNDVNAASNACSGFWDGNLLNTGTGNAPDADELAGLAALGYGSLTVIQKIATTGGAPANFTQMLYGETVIGIHFGGGASLFKNAVPGYNGNGGGTAFYKFDAGTAGLDTVVFANYLASASSGAALYKTGDQPTPPPIPEPSTYALMLAGLGALGLVARRRSRKQ